MKRILLIVVLIISSYNLFAVNTLTNSTSGLLAYEDWNSLAQGSTVTFAVFNTTYLPTSFTWTVSGAGGRVGIQCLNQGVWAPIGKTITSKSTVIQSRSLIVSGGYGWNLYEQRGATGNTINPRGGDNYEDSMARLYQRSYSNGAWTVTNPLHSTSDIYPSVSSFTWAYSTWYDTKVQFKDKKCSYNYYPIGRDSVLSIENPTYILRSFGNGYKSYAHNDLLNKSYVNYLMFCDDNTATFTGLMAGMKVIMWNAAETAILFTNSVTSTADNCVIEFGNKLFPISSVIEIIGTDGSQQLKTTAQNIYGGDVWTYSGTGAVTPTDTPTPANTNTPTPNATQTFEAAAQQTANAHLTETATQQTGAIATATAVAEQATAAEGTVVAQKTLIAILSFTPTLTPTLTPTQTPPITGNGLVADNIYTDSQTRYVSVGDTILVENLPDKWWLDSINVTGDVSGTVAVYMDNYQIWKGSYVSRENAHVTFKNPILIDPQKFLVFVLESGTAGNHSVSLQGSLIKEAK